MSFSENIEGHGIMLSLPLACRIYFSVQPVDFRKSFSGLQGEVVNFLGKNPGDGSLFVFYNKRIDSIKMLLYDNDGFWIFYKRLERGTFQLPFGPRIDNTFNLSHHELQCILSGIDLQSIRYRKRYGMNK